MDNAIEACEKFDEEEMRVISLTIKEQNGFVMIHCENYTKEELTFVDGLPLTSKQDIFYHGYGTKSIRMIVENYEGSLQMQAIDQIFSVDILLPLKENE